MPSHSPSINTGTSSTSSRPSTSRTNSTSASSWTPKPIQILFSHFPLQTLPANALPRRSLPLTSRKQHTLFVFTTTSSGTSHAAKVPSFNPTCLKWQTYLSIRGIPFTIQPSNNHASPSGSLPFLITSEPLSSKEGGKNVSGGNTISAGSLQSWTKQHSNSTQGQENETLTLRESAFLSLLEHRIRPAWLHAFYLTANLESLAAPLYIHTITTSRLLRTWQTVQLRTAAKAEVKKVAPRMDLDVLYSGAESAFEALETALASGDWFFGAEEPGMLDAAVFGYTCLLSDERLGRDVGGIWSEDEGSQRLREMLRRFSRLGEHQKKIYDRYFSAHHEKA